MPAPKKTTRAKRSVPAKEVEDSTQEAIDIADDNDEEEEISAPPRPITGKMRRPTKSAILSSASKVSKRPQLDDIYDILPEPGAKEKTVEQKPIVLPPTRKTTITTRQTRSKKDEKQEEEEDKSTDSAVARLMRASASAKKYKGATGNTRKPRDPTPVVDESVPEKVDASGDKVDEEEEEEKGEIVVIRPVKSRKQKGLSKEEPSKRGRQLKAILSQDKEEEEEEEEGEEVGEADIVPMRGRGQLRKGNMEVLVRMLPTQESPQKGSRKGKNDVSEQEEEAAINKTQKTTKAVGKRSHTQTTPLNANVLGDKRGGKRKSDRATLEDDIADNSPSPKRRKEYSNAEKDVEEQPSEDGDEGAEEVEAERDADVDAQAEIEAEQSVEPALAEAKPKLSKQQRRISKRQDRITEGLNTIEMAALTIGTRIRGVLMDDIDQGLEEADHRPLLKVLDTKDQHQFVNLDYRPGEYMQPMRQHQLPGDYDIYETNYDANDEHVRALFKDQRTINKDVRTMKETLAEVTHTRAALAETREEVEVLLENLQMRERTLARRERDLKKHIHHELNFPRAYKDRRVAYSASIRSVHREEMKLESEDDRQLECRQRSPSPSQAERHQNLKGRAAAAVTEPVDGSLPTPTSSEFEQSQTEEEPIVDAAAIDKDDDAWETEQELVVRPVLIEYDDDNWSESEVKVLFTALRIHPGAGSDRWEDVKMDLGAKTAPGFITRSLDSIRRKAGLLKGDLIRNGHEKIVSGPEWEDVVALGIE